MHWQRISEAARKLATSKLRHEMLTIGSLQKEFLRQADQKLVTLIPMSHFASQPFYDSVLAELAKKEVDAVLVEGVFANEQDREAELAELRALSTDRKLALQIARAIESQGSYIVPREELIAEAHFYGLTADVVDSLKLRSQSMYWRQLAKCYFPEKLVLADSLEKDAGQKEQRRRALLGTLETLLISTSHVAVPWGFHHTAFFDGELPGLGFVGTGKTVQRSYGWNEEAVDMTVLSSIAGAGAGG
eukprot:NODE_3265_length_1012_cov_23.396677_g3003_i0.p1 GENE.NODE_3265_length_1012_cov_23.396677_g3003_i0~~NODE_3265_length_1012_cov_23.396677_g3003_i0.p1  ORF type:complete len:246 (+),score=51.72 NODE_3265_length_1012_cov_23.396677_g3003_i0:152-889(+)